VDEASPAAAARARSDPGSCAVVLVEGMSDQAAVQTLAERSGRDLRRDGVFVVPMGGATNIGRRFMGTRSGRKIRYGHVLAAALDLARVPGPLAGLLSAV